MVYNQFTTMSKKIIIAVLALVVVIGFTFWRFGPNLFKSNTPQGPVTLTYWGLWEDDSLIKPLIESYQSQNPNVKINYVKQSSVNYRTRIQTQIRNRVGPDVFRIHNSWIDMFQGDLSPAPAEAFSQPEYQSIFYPIAFNSFIKNGQILAAPMEIDGLALFVNNDILAAANVTVPKTWQEFIDSATKMTVRDQYGQIKTAGAAVGNVANVDHWSDILGLLMMQQPKIDFNNLSTPAAAEVFRFYTGFITNPNMKTWDALMPSSTQAFYSGRLAYYFAPSWKAFDLRQANPNLKFKVVPVPQLPPNPNVAWASFWAEAVSSHSQHKLEAWKFIKFLTSKEAEKLAYKTASSVRLFGEPYSRLDLAAEIVNDPVVGAFVAQAPYYKSWYLNSNTYDSGINEEMSKYFEDGINATLQGQDPQVALQTVNKGVQDTLTKYTKPAVATGQR